jgi:hypothetical protein
MFIAQEKRLQENNDFIFPAKKVHNGFSAESCLDVACETFPVIRNTIINYGDHTLSEYLNHIKPESIAPAYQPMDDLLEAVKRNITPLLGESVAKRTADEIEANPIILTANHHGVVYFAQDFQGSLIFSLDKFCGQSSGSTVPVFSCGTVPLDNLTYPLGLLLYRVGNGELDAVPRKLPVFSNKVRRRLVSVADPVNEDMIKRAEKRLDKLVRDKVICRSLAEPVQTILQKEYRAPTVMDLVNYSRQAVVLNNAIWKRMFSGLSSVPEIVCLELEKISGALLDKDLKKSESLVSSIMFDEKLRENTFEGLDGKKACWQTKKLLKRLHVNSLDESEKRATKGCGTMLFWGIDDRGNRVPLYLDTTSKNGKKLYGINDRGKSLEWPYSPESIRDGLNQGKLLPSIFTSFLVVSLARGLVCAGGYFQSDYLPVMQRGIVNALKKTGGYDEIARLVSNVTTNVYLSGMTAVMTRIGYDLLIPAGPVEILAGGGIRPDDIERLRSLTVKDAHLSAMFETLPDLPFLASQTPDWKTKLAADAARLLNDRVVIK